MLYKKRRRRFRLRKIHCIILVFIILIILIIRGFEAKVETFSRAYLPNFAQQITTDAVTDAVNKKLAELNYSYNDIAKIMYSDSGEVQSIETDSVKINKLKSEITKAAQAELVKIKHSNMYIPIGAFTGLSLISNSGPEVALSFCLTGSFNSQLESTFESVGINSTIHHIKLILTSKIVTASVDYEKEIVFDTDFEIAQSVISGDIPSVYGGLYSKY